LAGLFRICFGSKDGAKLIITLISKNMLQLLRFNPCKFSLFPPFLSHSFHKLAQSGSGSAIGLHTPETLTKYLKESAIEQKKKKLEAQKEKLLKKAVQRRLKQLPKPPAGPKISEEIDLEPEYVRSIELPQFVAPGELAKKLELPLHELVRDSINIFQWFPDVNTTIKQMRKTNFVSVKSIVLNFAEAAEMSKLYRVKAKLVQLTKQEAIQNAEQHYNSTPSETNNDFNRETPNKINNNSDKNGNSNNMIVRTPVIGILGHKDHGKTTLLDTLRGGNTAKKEKFGITQEIYAHTIELTNSLASAGQNSVKKFSFLDSPGHHSFTEMRQVAASAADIVLFVVASDEGLLNQSYESLAITKEIKIPVIVAISKVDHARSNVAAVRKELERIGIKLFSAETPTIDTKGDMVAVEISAKQGINVEKLISALFNVSNELNLRVPVDCVAQGTVVEAWKERGRGNVLKILLKQGTLQLNQHFFTDAFAGRVVNLMDSKGNQLNSVEPGVVAEIMGCSGLPSPGAEFFVANPIDSAAFQSQAELKINYYEQNRFSELSRDQIDQSLARSRDEIPQLVRKIKRGDISKRVLLVPSALAADIAAPRKKLSKYQRKVKREETKMARDEAKKAGITNAVQDLERDSSEQGEIMYEQRVLILKSVNIGSARMLEGSIDRINRKYQRKISQDLIQLIDSTGGLITISDVRAAAQNSCNIYSFRVPKPGPAELEVAQSAGVKIRNYQHFQDLLDDLEDEKHFLQRKDAVFAEVVRSELFDHKEDERLNPKAAVQKDQRSHQVSA
jgi:small GTP-binding protein